MESSKLALVFLLTVSYCVHSYGQDSSEPPSNDSTTTPPAKCGLAPVPIDDSIETVITAQLGQVPWQVSVEAKSMFGIWKHSCGGVVITKQAVVTTASCAGGFPGMNRAESGIVDLPKGGWVRRKRFDFPGAQKPGLAYIESVKVHPDYDKKTLANNIAVLRLAMPFDFVKSEGNITNACLPEKSASKMDDESLFVSGWGSKMPSTNSKEQLRPQLQISKAKIVDCPTVNMPNEFCVCQGKCEDESDSEKSQLNDADNDDDDDEKEDDDDVVTEETTTTVKPIEPIVEHRCEGDIGGPIFTSANDETGSIVLGIASHGTNCTKEDPMFFIDIFPYLEFINNASKPYY